MFQSLFSTSAPSDPLAPTFHSVSANLDGSELFGKLEDTDSHWLCASGFATETKTFYTITKDGTSIMCQIIYSSVGPWFPTIQFTYKLHNPNTKETVWKSVNVSNFVTPPPGLDKRSCKADEFSLTYEPNPESDHPESYIIRANLSATLQISLTISRPESVPGYKIGNGPQGGYSYFGPDPKKAEGYVIHRFWPRTVASGHIIQNGQALAVEGPGMFVHAIQGMRPNLVASRWNFAHFQSEEHGGVSAIQMEFTTLETHGRSGEGSGPVTVNVGSLVIGGKLAAVTAETKWPDEEFRSDAAVVSRARHLNTLRDQDTGYMKPSALVFEWAGRSLLEDAQGTIKAEIEVDVGDLSNPKGLIEKVDVLAEIPYVVKMAVNYVAKTKPYIYQWMNPVKLSITGPDSVLPGLSDGLEIPGHLYTEATFISRP